MFCAVASLRSGLGPPYEWRQLAVQIAEIGWRSLPLVVASGFAMGVVTTLHTRSTLVQFGAAASIPGLQSIILQRAWTTYNRFAPRGKSGGWDRSGTRKHAGY